MDRFTQLGFNQFNVGPSEPLWAATDDPAKKEQAVRQVDEFTDRLIAKGATWYANLNILWPTSGQIAAEDHVACFIKRVWALERLSPGRQLEVSFVSEVRWQLDRSKSRVYLFDLTDGRYRDISSKLTEIRTIEQVSRESSAERSVANKYTLILEMPEVPPSHDLRVTFLGDMERPAVPGSISKCFSRPVETGGATLLPGRPPPSPGCLCEGRPAGISFGDEINTHRVSLFGPGQNIDFTNDAIAMQAYRDWLKRRFKTVAELDAFLGTKSGGFEDVTWRLCIYPFLERDRRQEEEKPSTFGLFDSFEQLERIDRLQEEFRVWFYGHWLAMYGQMAKEIIGAVPVFVTSAGLGGVAEDYLQIHKYALLEGLDGLSRNHYAWVGRTAEGRPVTFVPGTQTRFPLETVSTLLESAQSQSGRTKAYWANEFGRPRREEDGFRDDFGLGRQFPSRRRRICGTSSWC